MKASELPVGLDAYTPGTPEYLARVQKEADAVKAKYQKQPKTGPRGGRYTEAKTKDGTPYRRYF